MALPAGDWASMTDADEDCRLSKRSQIMTESSIIPSSHLEQKKSKKKVTDSATVKRPTKTKSKKSSESSFDDPNVLGSAAWVSKELESVGLSKLLPRFASQHFPLELLVFVEDHQLDSLLQSKNEPFPEPIDYIKLQCSIKAMRVKLNQSTGPLSKPKQQKSNQNTNIDTLPQNHQAHSQRSIESQKDVQKLLQGDVLLWDESSVQTWLRSIPSLQHLCPLFAEHEIDGLRLLRLTERKLLQKLKIDCDRDRLLLMHHISDLKALQINHASSYHSEIMNKLIQGLSVELSALKSNVQTFGASNAKRVPNYFISLRIGSPELRSKVAKIQKEIENAIPELSGSRSILPPEQLHFTLGRLYLQSEDEIKLAKSLLEDCYNLVYKKIYTENQPVAVNFRGVVNYGGNTVFLETERGNERDLLIEFGNTVYEHFFSAGLTSKEFRFQPVAPVLRVRQSKKALTQKLQEASSSVLEPYQDTFLGRNIFSSIDISSVSEQTDEDGYYKNMHSVALH